MEKSLSQLLGFSSALLSEDEIEELTRDPMPELAAAAQKRLDDVRSCNAKIQALLSDPEWQERAANRRAESGAAAIHCKTCDRCSRQCENLDVHDTSFYDWCAECKRHLCGPCFQDGCCGNVPAKSGLMAM